MRKCLHHVLEKWLIVRIFYNGLLYTMRMTVDAALGGAFSNKPYDEAYSLKRTWNKTTVSGLVNVILN